MSIVAALLLVSMPAAFAQDAEVELDPSLPIPTLNYDRPPPDFSWEIGVMMTYGTITYWQQELEPWVGFGLRLGWGRNVGANYAHRIGVTGVMFAEGPMPVHASVGIDPQLSWDYISDKNIWLGAGVGAAAMLNSKTISTTPERYVSLAPSVSARIGWSQTWSRVGRRLFVGFEARARYTNGNVGPQGALVLGSGKGY